MIHIVFGDALAACKIFEVLRDLLDDVTLHITGEGLKLMTLDPAHVAVVSAQWRKDMFTTYDGVTASDDIVIGIKSKNLLKLLSFAQKGDTLEWIMSDPSDDTLTVLIKNPLRLATFSLKLIDLITDEMHVPQMEIQSCATMVSSEFATLVKDLGTISDTVLISTGDAASEGILFEASGDIGHAKVRLKSASIEQITPVRLAFSLRYLASFAKASGIADRVSLFLTHDMPLCVEFKSDVCTVRYYLAPKLDDDGDGSNDADDPIGGD